MDCQCRATYVPHVADEPPGKGWRVRANAEDDEDQGGEHLAYALRARAPEMPPNGHQQSTTGTSSTPRT